MPVITLLTTTMPGLGTTSRAEIESVLGDRVSFLELLQTRTYDLNLFKCDGPNEQLLRLRTTEDVLWVLTEVKLTGQPVDLKQLVALRLPGLAAAASMRQELHGTKPKGRLSYRVIIQAQDEFWRKYRRLDMARQLVLAVGKQAPNWHLVDDNADIEVWAEQIGHRLIVCTRLSDASMRQRGYKQADRPAALRPTVAAALVWLSEPSAGDVFLDPMCGSGTILLERAQAGRYKLLLGGDIESAAVDATIENFGRKHKPWEIKQWDVNCLPLSGQSVNVAVTNPPWGRQISDPAQVAKLYRTMLSELSRVLVLDGRMIIISSQWELLRRSIKQTKGLRIVKTIKNVSVLGWHADVFVIQKSQN